MKNDGITLVLIITSIMGVGKLIWNYANLKIEVEDLRRKLGRT